MFIFIFQNVKKFKEPRKETYSQESNLNRFKNTLFANIFMICLPKVNNFSQQLFADYNINRFDVQMHDFVASQISQTMNHIQKDANLSPKRNSFLSYHDKIVKFISLNIFHH